MTSARHAAARPALPPVDVADSGAAGPGPLRRRQLRSDTVPAAPSQHDAVAAAKPTLVFVHSPTSGRSRRAEGFLAQVLQRRRNHDTFTLRRVNYDERPDLAARLGVKGVPAVVVIEANRVSARLEQPRGCLELTTVLAPWLK